jgi:nicotinate-nucleotide--dimethylbenzimidazole phosphoribosyltransferase
VNSELDWLARPIPPPDPTARLAAETRQRVLTKPPGALGRLEAVAIRLAALQGTEQPQAERIHIVVFVADHGVAAEAVSAFPQAVTGEMLRNFAQGGAAICVIARELRAKLQVMDLGTLNDPGALAGVQRERIAPSTANFTAEPAMTDAQLARALCAGYRAAESAKHASAHLFIGGDMGIANTTAAAAIACALLGLPPEQLAGPGTGLTPDGVAHKAQVIGRAIDRHRTAMTSPLEALRHVGGFEIAALAGSYLACAQMRLPVLVDGFIATSAALVAVGLHAGVADWLLYAHASAEPGHRMMLRALAAEPLLDLGMRLGEGTGAAAAVPLLRIACALHNNMATFADAHVSQGAV